MHRSMVCNLLLNHNLLLVSNLHTVNLQHRNTDNHLHHRSMVNQMDKWHSPMVSNLSQCLLDKHMPHLRHRMAKVPMDRPQILKRLSMDSHPLHLGDSYHSTPIPMLLSNSTISPKLPMVNRQGLDTEGTVIVIFSVKVMFPFL